MDQIQTRHRRHTRTTRDEIENAVRHLVELLETNDDVEELITAQMATMAISTGIGLRICAIRNEDEKDSLTMLSASRKTFGRARNAFEVDEAHRRR